MELKRAPDGVWPVLLTPFGRDLAINWGVLDALVDWQIEAGAGGLFIDALSAEVLQLTDKEKLGIARAVMKRTNGRVPVVAGAYSSGSLSSQIDLIHRMADTGVLGVVISACQVADESAGEDAWRLRLEEILRSTGSIPLGLYEMPVPYHRILTPEMICWVASTQRFCFHKDTTCDLPQIRQKLRAIQGTALGFFNANTPTLLNSLLAGGNGYSGIGANYLPELYVELCRVCRRGDQAALLLQSFLEQIDQFLHRRYPAAAKAFLEQRGVPILPVCRVRQEVLSEDDLTALRGLLQSAKRISDGLGLSLRLQ